MDKDVNHLLWWDLRSCRRCRRWRWGYLGTGMGNSLWLNGDFYHGAHGAAGELSTFLARPSGPSARAVSGAASRV